jgi:hypothetical protein
MSAHHALLPTHFGKRASLHFAENTHGFEFVSALHARATFEVLPQRGLIAGDASARYCACCNREVERASRWQRRAGLARETCQPCKPRDVLARANCAWLSHRSCSGGNGRHSVRGLGRRLVWRHCRRLGSDAAGAVFLTAADRPSLRRTLGDKI